MGFFIYIYIFRIKEENDKNEKEIENLVLERNKREIFKKLFKNRKIISLSPKIKGHSPKYFHEFSSKLIDKELRVTTKRSEIHFFYFYLLKSLE